MSDPGGQSRDGGEKVGAGSGGEEAVGEVTGSSDPGNPHDEESKGEYAAAHAAADAFALGQHQLRLEYYTESLWCDPGGPGVEAFNASHLTKDLLVAVAGLSRAAHRLEAFLRDASRSGLAEEIGDQATAFVEDLRQRWATDDHDKTSRGITEGTEPDLEYGAWETFLDSSPLRGDSKVALDEAINRLMARLAKPYDSLRELGRLVTSVDFPTILGGFRAYAPEGEGVYLTDILNAQIKAVMKGSVGEWPGLATVDWELSSCHPSAAREKLRRLQTEIPAAIAGLWVWCATPLDGDDVGNRTAAIQASLRGQYWNDKSTDQRYYVPTLDELSLVAEFCEGRGAGDPSWPAVEAVLIAAGDSREELARLNAPGLVSRLHEYRSSPQARDAQKGRGDITQPEVPGENVFRLSGEYWDVSFQGKTARLKNSVGLQRIAYLIARRGDVRSVPAIELFHLGQGVGSHGVSDHRDDKSETPTLSSSDVRDDVLDREASRGLRNRLSQIDADIHTAKHEGANAKALELEDERRQITQQLENASGPAGRKKLGKDEASSTAENILKGLRREYARIRKAALLELATHLERSITKGGTTFAYKPESNTPAWEI